MPTMAPESRPQNAREQTQPKSVVAAAHALLGLPLEIMHQIIEDVPLFRIIQMAASLDDSTHFYECLISHPKIRDLGLFPSRHHLAHIGSLHGLYHDIGKSEALPALQGRYARGPSSPLAQTLNVIMLGTDAAPFQTYESLRKYLLESITNMLNPYNSDSRKAEINAYLQARISQDWHENTLESMQGFWEQRKTRHQGSNAYRSTQIARIADIFESFPANMKKTSDPSLVARPNSDHIISTLRSYSNVFARKKFRSGRYSRISGNHLFRFDLFPIVPIDAWLRLFVDTLNKHPLPSNHSTEHADPASSNTFESLADLPVEKEDTEAQLMRALKPLSITSTSCAEAQLLALEQPAYPPYIMKCIKTAIAGMAYVYTLPAKSTKRYPKVLRTKYTPWSADPFRKPFDAAASLTRNETPTNDSNPTDQPTTSPWADFPSNKPRPREPGLKSIQTRKMKPREAAQVPTPRAPKILPFPLPTNAHQEPVFMAPPYRHFETMEARVKVDFEDVKYYYDAGTAHTHHHEMEFEWLEAFLKACDYMRGVKR